MIIGVALVVDELLKGQRLVFRYPEAHPSFALFSGELVDRFHQEYLALSPDNFARLFRPKPAFFNKILDITIGDINYISYPAPCISDSSGNANSAPPADSSENSAEPVDKDGRDRDKDRDDVITLFTVVVARVRDGLAAPGGQLGRPLPGVDPVSRLLGLSGQFLPVEAEVIRNLVTTVARTLLREQFRCGYVSREVRLMLGIQDAKNRDRARPPDRDRDDTVNTPKPIGVIRPVPDLTSLPASPSGKSAPLLLDTATVAALPVTDAPSGPMAMTDATVLPDTAISDGTASESAADSLTMTSPLPGPTPPSRSVSAPAAALPPEDGPRLNLAASFSELIMQHSTLANEFRSLYHSLVGGTNVNLTINRCLWIAMPLHGAAAGAPPVAHRPPADGASSAIDGGPDSPIRPAVSGAPGNRCGGGSSTKKPFQTFLPVGDEASLRTVVATMQARAADASAEQQPEILAWAGLAADVEDMQVGRAVDDEAALQHCLDPSPTAAARTTGSSGYAPSPTGDAEGRDLVTGLVSGRMWDFLRLCDPTRPFAEQAELMECTLEEVFEMADHLEKLGLGRTITCLSAASVFAVHPEADVDVTSRASRSFHGVYGSALGCELHEVLTLFNGAAALGEVLEKVSKPLLADYMLDIMSWLLRWNLVVEINMYLFDPTAASGGPERSMGKESSSKAALASVPSADETDGVLTRADMEGYLDGRTSITELMWLQPELRLSDILAFAENSGVCVLHRYCCPS